jgi:hypothetical protein
MKIGDLIVKVIELGFAGLELFKGIKFFSHKVHVL